jgi:hypothetical protein
MCPFYGAHNAKRVLDIRLWLGCRIQLTGMSREGALNGSLKTPSAFAFTFVIRTLKPDFGRVLLHSAIMPTQNVSDEVTGKVCITISV